MEHTAEKLHDYVLGSLYRDEEVSTGEVPKEAVIVEGLLGKI